jgi:hypothetical protein
MVITMEISSLNILSIHIYCYLVPGTMLTDFSRKILNFCPVKRVFLCLKHFLVHVSKVSIKKYVVSQTGPNIVTITNQFYVSCS